MFNEDAIKFSNLSRQEIDFDEQFIIENLELISTISEKAASDNYTIFRNINGDLETLLNLYRLVDESAKTLSTSILKSIFDPDDMNIKDMELKLNKLPYSNGLYYPLAGSEGGGDIWLEKKVVGSRGMEISKFILGDIVGHGPKTLLPKYVIKRLIDLYYKDNPPGTNIFTEIDDFTSNKCLGKFSMDLIQAWVEEGNAQEPAKLKIEKSGISDVIIRDPDTGRLYLSKKNSQKKYKVDPDDINLSLFQLDTIIGIGTGDCAKDRLPENEFLLSGRSYDVFLMTDGLRDIKMVSESGASTTFDKALVGFCLKNGKLNTGDFLEEIRALVETATVEGRVNDDITLVMLSIRNGKLVLD